MKNSTSAIFPDIYLNLGASHRIAHTRTEKKRCDDIFEKADKIAPTQQQIDFLVLQNFYDRLIVDSWP